MIKYDIYKSLKLYLATLSGTVYFHDIFRHVELLMADKEYYVGINAIYDFTNVEELKGEVRKFRDLANNMSNQSVITKQAKTAILINKDQVSVRAMMEGYLIMTSDSNIDFKIFNEFELEEMKSHVDLPNSFDLSAISMDCVLS